MPQDSIGEIQLKLKALTERPVLDRRPGLHTQGYYLAWPMPGAQFAEWYRHAGPHQKFISVSIGNSVLRPKQASDG